MPYGPARLHGPSDSKVACTVVNPSSASPRRLDAFRTDPRSRNPWYQKACILDADTAFSRRCAGPRRNWLLPLVWAGAITVAYEVLGQHWIAIPSLPMSLIGISVAFYLGFKNNASYDRQWEARKIWGAIVNASRSWAFSSRDLVGVTGGNDDDDLASTHRALVARHIAWMDALRHQLRQVKTWEHRGPMFDQYREPVPEYNEDLRALVVAHVGEAEAEDVLKQINPAAHLLANQSRTLHALRRRGLLDGFSHTHLQSLLQELMTQQGKAERIKNYPLPRQYSTVNHFFAILFAGILPLALLPVFDTAETSRVWLTIPFSAIVSWVFLTADQIGDWSENPFEGLAKRRPDHIDGSRHRTGHAAACRDKANSLPRDR